MFALRPPSFWWHRQVSLTAHLLSPLGAIVGSFAQRRMERDGASASVPVICIGNPVVGGAGKTPTALEMARLLYALGRKPVFLSRGYGGAEKGPVLVDPGVHTAYEVGDEPLLLARVAPCIVARDRLAGAAFAATHGDVIVMDDGFQNPSLNKDVSILVVDAEAGVGNGLCLPAGPLRAPLDAQLVRADALVLIGQGSAGEHVARQSDLPVLRASLVSDRQDAERLSGQRVLAFCGIGRPEKFAASLRQVGAEVVQLAEFPDHHVFTPQDQERLTADARRLNAALVTTHKDKARLGESQFSRSVQTLSVNLTFEDESAAQALVQKALA